MADMKPMVSSCIQGAEAKPELDAFDTPTVDLLPVHQALTEGAVPILPRADAWKISREDDWVEPLGTRKGVWTR
jgi:hypothetical protein